MLLIGTAADPRFDMVTLTGGLLVPTFWSPKLTETGLSVTGVPAPESGIKRGLPTSPYVIMSDALRGPAVFGVNVTFKVHTLCWLKIPTQCFAGIVKSLAFTPTTRID